MTYNVFGGTLNPAQQLTESLLFIKPSEVYRQAYMYLWVNIVAPVAVHLVHVNFT